MKDKDSIILEKLYTQVLLEAPAPDVELNTDAVERLKAAIKGMIERGEPTTYDAEGFNKPDFTEILSPKYVRVLEIPNEPLKASMIFRLLSILAKYKNTQLRKLMPAYNYEGELHVLKHEIKQAGGNPHEDDAESFIIDYDDHSYGKVSMKFPDSLKTKYNKTLKDFVIKFCEERGMKKEPNKFTGNMEYPIYKVFQDHKGKLNTVYADKELADRITKELYANFPVKIIGGNQDETNAQANGEKTKPKVIVLGMIGTRYGARLNVKFRRIVIRPGSKSRK